MPYELLANVVLTLHTALVAFVVAGLVLIVIGNLIGWRWVNALWFRLLHIGTIGIVVAESWLGIECPLTTLERWLRVQAHATSYEGSFIEHWLQAVLFWSAPAWVFTVAYTVFGLAVAATWWFFPPRLKSRPTRAALDAKS
jgi:hypothetical protein